MDRATGFAVALWIGLLLRVPAGGATAGEAGTVATPPAASDEIPADKTKAETPAVKTRPESEVPSAPETSDGIAVAPAAPASKVEAADAITQASYDAKTGASQMVEVKVAEAVSFKYTTLANGRLSITVEELSRAYALDELAADKAFRGKRMRVWGTVAKTSPPGAAKGWIVFAPEKKAAKDKDIRCAMRTPPPANLEAGTPITVEGVCAGMTFNVNLTDALITK